MHSVIQADRDAAGNIWRDFVARAGECIAENAIRSGGMDDGALVQAFAAHRIAEQAELVADIRQALVQAVEAIKEFQRYQYGGETRGSYDGRPERDGLWRAMRKGQAALAPLSQSKGEG